MVQGLKFLSKKSFHPQNRSNQKRVWEREQEKHHEQTQWHEREAQLRRERHDEELAQSRGDRRRVQFLYQPPPGLLEVMGAATTVETKNESSSGSSNAKEQDLLLVDRQPGDDDAAAAFRRLLAGHATTEEETTTDTTNTTTNTFGTVLQGSNADRSDAPKPVLTALEQSVGRNKKHYQHLTFDEQIQRFPALANAPRAKGVSATDVGVTFQPLGTQIRNVRCLACGTWGHSRGDRECSKTGWDPFANHAVTTSRSSRSALEESSASVHPSTEQATKRHKDDPSSRSSSDDEDDSLKDRKRRHKRHRSSRDRSPSRSSKKRKEKKKSKKSRNEY